MHEELRTAANKIILLAKESEKEENKTRKRILIQKIEEQMTLIEKDLLQKITPKIHIDWIQRRSLKEELSLKEKDFKRIYTQETKTQEQALFGKIANTLFGTISEKIAQFFPGIHRYYQKKIIESGSNILSLSYISISLSAILLSFALGTLGGIILYSIYNNWYFLLSGIIVSLLTSISFLFYPILKAKKREKDLEQELPFFIHHCAALTNTEIKTKAILEIIQETPYYKAFKIDCMRILNNHSLFNKTIEESLKDAAEKNPSQKTKEFFLEYAKILTDKKNPSLFLTEKAKNSIHEYTKQKTVLKRIQTHWREIQALFSLKEFFLLSILIFGGIGALFLAYKEIDLIFFLSIGLGTIAVMSLLMIRKGKEIDTEKKQEKQFIIFLQDLKETKNLLQIEKNYKELEFHIDKLKNQYKLGIPQEKVWETFGKEIRNPLIKTTITMSLQAKKKGANFYLCLYELGTSKMLREIVKN